MSKIILKICLTTFLSLSIFCGSAAAFFWDDDTLVTIDEQSWTIQDYQSWWKEWKEKDMTLPETPDTFIDWILLSNEAEQMQLFDQPRYRQKINTFLKVRSLMMLKQEEVDSKISISEDDIAATYYQDYSPLLTLRSLQFNNKEQCDLFLAATAAGKTTEEVLNDSNLSLPSDGLADEIVQRPNQLPLSIRAMYDNANTKVGYLPAYQFNDSWFIIEIIGEEPGYDSDLGSVAENIEYTIRKQRQRELTGKLNMQLIEKFNVLIDTDIAQQVHIEGPDAEIAEQTVITFPNMKISAQLLYDNAISHYNRYGGQKMQNTTFEDIVQRVMNDIIAQTVTTLEALDRHYEEIEPFKSVFSFYQRHRLIRELEDQLIHPHTDLSEAEIVVGYESNKQNYAFPERVKFASVETKNERMALQLRDRLRQGDDFNTVLTPLSPTGIETKTLPTAHLIPELQQLVVKLRPGQSEMLQVDDKFHFIRLIESPKVEYQPLEKVRDQLTTELTQQKFDQTRSRLTDQLRQRSTITVNQRNWQSCIKQLTKGQ